jgi:hypothetical protein
MYLVFTASKDTYITNKIISTSARATDANLGGASTLDLFKLYDETAISGETTPIELSRALIKFELQDISASLKDKVSFDDGSFNCVLKLHDVQGNQIAPSDFSLAVFPLSSSFDEGKGKDVASMAYLDRCNWLTSSYTTTNVVWNSGGAMASGTLGASNIDIIEDGDIGGNSTYFVKNQAFEKGSEDLAIDITTIVSASMCGLLPNHGFLIAYSGSQEHDHQSRFVKRFASRHSRSPYMRPKLIVRYDDSQIDRNESFEFNVTGSLFLESYSRGARTNFISGSAATSVTGHNCVILKLHTGSFSSYFTGSQHYSSGLQKSGVYTASFAIDQYVSASVTSVSTLAEFAAASGSVTFGQEWLSLDENISYFTGSLTIDTQNNTNATHPPNIAITAVNINSEYRLSDEPEIQLFVRDVSKQHKSVRVPRKLPSLVLNEAYYRIKDPYGGNILTPFVKTGNGTRLSARKDGMYFQPSFEHLVAGKVYTVEILVVENNVERVYDTGSAFRIVI